MTRATLQNTLSHALLFACLLGIFSCRTSKPAPAKTLFAKDNLLAWCIVPYDAKSRNAEARARMLHELGFTKFVYDWREQHLATFDEELQALKRHGVKLEGVWFWVDGGGGELLDRNHWHILETLRQNDMHTTLWVSFNPRFFENISDAERLAKAARAVSEIRRIAAEAGCKIALYNHGDWFGDPHHQIEIINALQTKDIGLVYNFHHAHDQIAQFPQLLQAMQPYLWTVNLNGMRAAGPKILPLGEGESELDMLRALRESQFKGSIGILGHVEEEDARVVLERNLAGLQALLAKLGDEEALRTYRVGL